MSHPEIILTPEEESKLNSLLNRLLSGEPLPYLIEQQEFFGINFKVSPDVLIPRPETELLVEFALDWLLKRKKQILIADVGTGSGCIAVAIAKQIPSVKITGIDFSYKALQIAKENVIRQELEIQINLVQSDLLKGLRGQFDCICANLPYIPTDTLSLLAVKNFEPLAALDGGKDGLRYIKPLLKQSKNRIKPNGLILLEIESTQFQSVLNLAAIVFPAASIRIHTDLAGLPRLVKIQLTGD